MTNRFIRRLICVLLAAAILTGLLASMFVSAASSYQDPNISLLDAMLSGKRKWVVETIVEDDRSHNPYAIAYSNASKSLMATAFSQLENEADPDFNIVYSIVLQALLQFYYDKSWSDDLVDAICSAEEDGMGLFGKDDALILAFVGGLKDRTAELRYESIITGALMDNYTASWGETAEQQEVALRQLTEIGDTTANLDSLSGRWATTHLPGDSDDTDLILAFNRDVVGPYVNNGIRYLQAIEKIAEDEKDTTDAVLTSAKCAVAINWLMENSAEYDYCSLMVEDMKEHVGGNKVVSLLETVSTLRDLDDAALAQYMFLHQLMEHSDTFHDTLLRVAWQADVDNRFTMQMTLENVAQQMDDVIYSDQLNYNLAMNLLDEFSGVQDSLKVSSIAKSLMGKKMKDAVEETGLKKISAAVGAGFFLVEQAFNLEETCLMLSEMQYLRDLIDEAKQVYYSDVSAYKSSKTGENARKVMSDLLFLQRLRLRGENLARGLVGSQLNSPAGRLFSGSSFLDFVTGDETELSEGWNAHYQRSIDCLIGATLDPYGIEPIRVGPGEKLIIYYDSECKTYRGGFLGSSVAGNVLFEMQYRVMPGIIVDGGELVLTDGIEVPAVTVMNGSNLSIDPSVCKIGELTQSGGTLTVRNANLSCDICVDLSSVTVDLNGYRLTTPDLTLWGTNTFSNGPIMTGDLHLYSTAVSGATIYCTGDVEASGTTAVEALVLNGTEKQYVTGPLWGRNLTMDNSRTDGICSDGEILVTGLLSDPVNDDPGGISLYETADISGSQVASDLTLLGTDISHAVHYLGNVTTTGSASTAGGHIDGFLLVRDGTFTNRSSTLTVDERLHAAGVSLVVAAPITVNADTYFDGTAFSGGSVLSIHGDAAFNAGNTSDAGTVIALYGNCTSDPNAASNVLGTVRLAGSKAQNFGFTGTISSLEVVNDGIYGVNVTGTTRITRSFTGRNQRVRNGKQLILTGDADARLENFNTDLTIRDWHGDCLEGLKGTLYADGDNIFAVDMDFAGGLRQSGGSIAVQDAIISFGENLECGGAWTIDANSNLLTAEDAGFSGGLTNHGMVAARDLALACAMTGDGIVVVGGNLTSTVENRMAELILSGPAGQTVSGKPLTVGALTASNTSAWGICFESPVYISGSFTASSQRLRGGENLILTGGSSAVLDNVTGDLSMADWTGDSLAGLNGTLYVSGDNTITTDVDLRGGIRQTGGSITIDGAVTCREGLEGTGAWTITENGSLSTAGDAVFQGAVVNDGTLQTRSLRLDSTYTGGGAVEVGGDLTSKVENQLEDLTLSGTVAQTVSGETITVTDLTAANTSAWGIRIDSPVCITGTLNAASQRLRADDNLILTGSSTASMENVTGNIHIRDWSGAFLTGLNGTLYASGDNTITTDVALRGGIRQTGGSVTIDGAAVTCRDSLECAGTWTILEGGTLATAGDAIIRGAVTNDGTLKAGNLQLDSALTGAGTLEVTGDLTTAAANTCGVLRFSGSGLQTVSGSPFTVAQLHNRNTSGRGVVLKARVYITDKLDNGGVLRGVQPMQVTDVTVYTADAETAALAPAGDVAVSAGVTLTVNGDLTISGALLVESGASLEIRGDLAGSGTITVAEGAQVTVRGNLRLSSTAMTLDGHMLVFNDSRLSGGTVQGAGTLELRGDFDNGAAISGLDTLRLSGRVPQLITGSNIHVANAAAENTSSGGAELKLKVYYSESLYIAPGCNVSENHFVEE